MTDLSQPHLFCFGLGYSAKNLALKLLEEGWRVSGTHRSMDACEAERANGITAYLFDHDIPLDNVWDMNTVSHILISIPPGEDGDLVLAYHLPIIKTLSSLQWVGYLSTTGVYGNHDGAWVDETTPVMPPNDRTRRRVNAEQAWIDSGLPVHIFRLSGIYGPERNAVQPLKNGSARIIDKPGHYFSRIHVDDINQCLQASMNQPCAGEIYNLADDTPCESGEVVRYAANLLGIDPPPIVSLNDPSVSDMARSFYEQNKRVSNQKIKDTLNIRLKYTSYETGLTDLIKAS